jgi:hypothetical protein
MADDATHTFFDRLATEIRAASEVVERQYPEAERASARDGIGAQWLGSGATGQGLFLALLDPHKIGGPADPKAREIERIDVDGGSATVVTKSGETVRFERDGGGRFRTAMFLEAFRDLPPITTWKENLETVRRNGGILAAPSPAGTPR